MILVTFAIFTISSTAFSSQEPVAKIAVPAKEVSKAGASKVLAKKRARARISRIEWHREHPRHNWHRTGASIFGNPCESGSTGYRGVNMNEHPWSFAELGNGAALGGLPSGTEVLVRNPYRKKHWAKIVKNDIGLGGGSVEGYERTFDLYAPLAKWLMGASCEWTGVIEYHFYHRYI